MLVSMDTTDIYMYVTVIKEFVKIFVNMQLMCDFVSMKLNKNVSKILTDIPKASINYTASKLRINKTRRFFNQ